MKVVITRGKDKIVITASTKEVIAILSAVDIDKQEEDNFDNNKVYQPSDVYKLVGIKDKIFYYKGVADSYVAWYGPSMSDKIYHDDLNLLVQVVRSKYKGKV